MTERDVFIAALQNEDPTERQAYLDEACARQPELRRQVEQLLRLYEGAGSFLEAPAAETATTGALPDTDDPASRGEAAGAGIGPYKLIEQIGEGGMGTVWMAQQTEPVKRLVAVKLIKAGMDSKQVIARFEAERQALALMDHPNIARVLDAGTTKAEPGGVSPGRPYFVMDLVRGVPITKYCDEHRLTPRQRLELFLPVCQAVQHAHQKGIIHRDLKPSNVLVALYDGKAVPRVIDFGVAKAAGQALTDKTLVTGFGNIIGTLEYMSPEQAEINQLDIDTRSDIYSLGVLLYELLAGSPPFTRKELTQAGMLEMLRVIREQEPLRPSTKLSTAEGLPTLAANRGTEPAKLKKLVRGELDWIVMKALEKDRNRRYESANAFAADVQRYLNDEPVQACPPSAWYRVCKFARRNKRVAAMAGFAAALLVMAVAVLGVSYAQVQEALRDKTQALDREQRSLYFQRIATAAQQLERQNLGRAEELLDQCPPPLRGWEWHYLKRRRYEKPRDLPHEVAVGRVAYSPDGRYLASVCRDGIVRVWERRSGQQLPSWKGGPEAHQAHVRGRGIAFSADSRYLATGGADGRILVLDLDAGTGRIFEGHADTITQLAFRPDGLHLASAGEDGTVRLWDLKTGNAVRTFADHQSAVRGLAFSAEGQVISVGADGWVKIWDPDTGVERTTFRARTRWVSTMAFHAPSRRLAVASWDGGVELWDGLDSSQPSAKEPRTLRGHTAQIASLAFSPDGCRLVSAGDDMLLKVWDATTGDEAIELDTGRVPVSVAFSPDGNELACGCSTPNAVLRLWDGTPLSAKPGKDGALSLSGHGEPVMRVAFSPDGKLLASASRDGTAKIWDAITGRELLTFREHNAIVQAVAFSPDGTRVASGSWDGNVLVWNASSGHVVHTLRGEADFVYDVAFSTDGKVLASAHSNGRVVLWDADAGKVLGRIKAHNGETEGVAFSPDSTLLATAGGRDFTAKIWTLATWEERAVLPGVTRRVHAITFSPDGKSVAAALGGYLAIWDVANANAEPFMFHTKSFRAWHLAFSPDGCHLASACVDDNVRLWDARTGQQIALLRGHAGPVLGVAFSRDGRRLASCGGYKGKGEIKIWDAASWETNQGEPSPRPSP
jgi:eukaryotic-like serine/threonine-protein kinase